MRRWLAAAMALVMMFVLSPLARAQVAVVKGDDKQGAVQVTLEKLPLAKIKVMVEKDDSRYFYTMSRRQESFPLQLGAGTYRLHVLEHTEGNKYKFVQTEELAVRPLAPESVFLSSVQNVPWEEAPQVVAKAQELTKKAGSARDKVKLIYSFVIDNIKYDYKKAARLPTDYLPDPEETLLSGQGICYDYASLFASMLRSVAIPTKLVMGNAEGVPDYHAWNEVYIDGQWLIIDPTVDAKLREVEKLHNMVKEQKAYQVIKIY